MTKKTIDLNYLLEDDDDEPVERVPVDIAGEEFMISQDVNAFQLARLGDPDQVAQAMTQILLGAVAEEDRDRLVKTLGSIPRLKATKLAKLFNGVLEAASGGTPTQSSSGSRRTTPKKVVSKRSVARSSAQA